MTLSVGAAASRPIYLDHQATTPVSARVLDAMLPFFREQFGNASSRSHPYGRAARDAVEDARVAVAGRIGASPKEIVFTSGATESNNLAVLGASRAGSRRRIVTVETEHKAVLDPVERLTREGFTRTVLPVGSDGLVDVDRFARALGPDVALVSVMLVNNEIGVVQPIAELSALAAKHGALFHCDAAQTPFSVVDVGALGVDLLSLSAHKCSGPKGVGALFVRRVLPRIPIEPLVFGGGHERGLRSGTLPVPLLVGMGVALSAAAEGLATGAAERVANLRDRLLAGVSAVGGVTVNGSLAHRAPHNLNLAFEGVEAEALMMAVRDVVALSTGSACSSETLEPSYVLRALGVPAEVAHTSVRFGLGQETTEAEIDAVVDVVRRKVYELRSMSGLVESGR